MNLSNLVATSALLGLTIVGTHAGSQTPQQPPPTAPPPAAPTTPPAGGGRQGRGNAVFLQQQRPPGDPAVIERIRSRALHNLDITVATGTSSTSAISV